MHDVYRMLLSTSIRIKIIVCQFFLLSLTMQNNIFLFCFFDFLQDRVSLCSFGCPGTHPIDKTYLELTEVCLPLPSECWN